MKRMLVAAAMLAIPIAVSATAGEKTWHFGTHSARTNITFESKAEIETIIGTTNQASGSATLDGEKVNVAISVPVASLRTGIDLRDEHLRGDKFLEAAKFPAIEFTAAGTATKKGDLYGIEGTLKIRGIEKKLGVQIEAREIPADLAAKAKLGAGEWIRVRGSFEVKLGDFGIKIPEGGAAKLSETIQITVDLFGTTEKPKEPGAMPESKTAKEVKAGDVKLEGEGVRHRFGVMPQLTNITAESKTELETVIASSTTLAGVVALDTEKGLGKVKLVVPVKSLRTGIEMRDEHLRSAMWLDGEKTPDISFESTKASKKDEKTWTVEGNFSMHGVTKAMTVEVTARAIPAEMVKKARWGEKPAMTFRTSFTVKLSDFGVKIPDIAAGKVQDAWTVTFDAVAIQE
jgi:polyisoprenoid-binding protein YceI